MRRTDLLAAFESVKTLKIATESAVWDVSGWDDASWSSDDDLYDRLLAAIRAGDRSPNKHNSVTNQPGDALTAETAIKNDLILVTDDIVLANATRFCGGTAISVSEFAST